MKKHFLTMMPACASVCLFLTLALPQHKCIGLSGINGNSQAPPRVSYFIFYIEKRQWLADARTIVAGIRYWYESYATDTIVATNIFRVKHWLFPRPGLSANQTQADAAGAQGNEIRPCLPPIDD
jgi:hypothetical protein